MVSLHIKVFEINIRMDAILLSENICEIISSTVHTTSEKFEKGVFTPKTHQTFFVHTKPEKFENGVHSLLTQKTHQIFSVHNTPVKFEYATISCSNKV